MARKRAAAKQVEETPDEQPEPDPFVPVVGRTQAAQAEWEAEQAEAAEKARLEEAERLAEGGAGPGATGDLG